MLAILLACALLGALVVIGALFGAVGVVLRREADHLVKIDRLTAENNDLQALANDQAQRLTRRRQPGIVRVPRNVPTQRKAVS